MLYKMVSILNSRTVPEDQTLSKQEFFRIFFPPENVKSKEESNSNSTSELNLETVPEHLEDDLLGRGVFRRRASLFGESLRLAEKTNHRDVYVMTVFKEKTIERLLPVVKIEGDTLYTYQLTPFDSFLPKLLYAVKDIELFERGKIQDDKFKFIHSKVIEMIDMYTTLHDQGLVFCDTKAENFGLTRSENGPANRFQMLDPGSILRVGSSTQNSGVNKSYSIPSKSGLAIYDIDYWGLALMMFQMTLPSDHVDNSDTCKMALSNMPMIAVAKQLEGVTEPSRLDWVDTSDWSAYVDGFVDQLKDTPPKLKVYGDKLDDIRSAAFELLKICVLDEEPEFRDGVLGHIKKMLGAAGSPSQDFMGIVADCH